MIGLQQSMNSMNHVHDSEHGSLVNKKNKFPQEQEKLNDQA